MEERRRGTRRELESKLVIKRIDEQDGEEVSISIIDVSKSGIGFSCDAALVIGAVYESYLRIWTKEVIHAFLEITRIEKKDNLFEYGAFFVGMPEIDSTRIDIYNTVERATRELEND